MSRKQFGVPTGTHTAKKTRKEKKAEMKASQEEFARQQEAQGIQPQQQNQSQVVETPLIDTAEDQQQFKNLLIWASVISVVLLALMYFIFVV